MHDTVCCTALVGLGPDPVCTVSTVYNAANTTTLAGGAARVNRVTVLTVYVSRITYVRVYVPQ